MQLWEDLISVSNYYLLLFLREGGGGGGGRHLTNANFVKRFVHVLVQLLKRCNTFSYHPFPAKTFVRAVVVTNFHFCIPIDMPVVLEFQEKLGSN